MLRSRNRKRWLRRKLRSRSNLLYKRKSQFRLVMGKRSIWIRKSQSRFWKISRITMEINKRSKKRKGIWILKMNRKRKKRMINLIMNSKKVISRKMVRKLKRIEKGKKRE